MTLLWSQINYMHVIVLLSRRQINAWKPCMIKIEGQRVSFNRNLIISLELET